MNDYMHALDRNREQSLNLPMDYIGISTPPMKDQLEGMKTRIFQGLSHIELGFMGTGKGSMSQGSTTPEMYGKDQRAAMRQLAKLNDVTLSTHATVGVQGMSGRTQEGFSQEAQEAGLNEIKRTIDFAADTAGGGPIVFHTGEFPRPVSQYEEFEGFPGEKQKGVINMANKETGQTFQLRRETPMSEPETDENNDYIIDTETGKIKFKTETIQKKIDDAKLKAGNENVDEAALAVEIYRNYRQKDIDMSEAEQKRYEINAEQIGKRRQEMEKVRDAFKRQLEDPQYQGNDQFRDRVKGEIIQNLRERGLYPGARELQESPEMANEVQNDPFHYLNEKVKEETDHEKSWRQAAISYGKKAHEERINIDQIDTIQNVGLERSADGIARAGIYAWKKGKSIDPKDRKGELFVAPENIWPDTGYGSHPEELKNIVQQSRNKMVERLTAQEIDGQKNPDRDPSINPQQAVKLANDHIRATFDIGHANIWRKYFKGDEKQFNDWMGKQIEDLNKEQIIGHVHISDNFGFEDEHITPGQGNAPIGEFTQKMRDSGFEGKMIIEPAHQDYEAWTGFMNFAQSPVYRTKAWTEIENSYLAQGSGSPTYVVGSYATDVSLPEDSRDFRFWSKLPIE
jgi:sugar phosphate isomerase/epimerase